MHACGHDMHMAIGLGVLTYFAQHEIKDNVPCSSFQPAEEGQEEHSQCSKATS